MFVVISIRSLFARWWRFTYEWNILHDRVVELVIRKNLEGQRRISSYLTTWTYTERGRDYSAGKWRQHEPHLLILVWLLRVRHWLSFMMWFLHLSEFSSVWVSQQQNHSRHCFFISLRQMYYLEPKAYFIKVECNTHPGKINSSFVQVDFLGFLTFSVQSWAVI